MTIESMKIIVQGPQGCGKTRNAGRFAAYFGCDRIVDDWDGEAPLPERALALTHREEIPDRPGSRVLDFASAMALCARAPSECLAV